MPSLFSRFRHKKTNSTSETNSPSDSPPSSPTRNTQNEVPSSPTRNQRASLDQRINSPSSQSVGRRSMDGTRPIVPVPAAFKPRSNVSSVPRESHSAAFGDETTRPDLPTTSSNVNNPQHDQTTKNLPSLPPISAGPPLDSSLSGSLHSSTQRNDIPPLPHVASVDRSGVLDQHTNRPEAIVSESHQQSGDHAKFPHVQGVSSGGASHISADSKYSDNDVDEIPPRSTSLHPERATDLTKSGNTVTSAQSSPYEAFRTVVDPDLTPEDFIAQYLHRMTLQKAQKPVVPKEYMGPFTTPALERERKEMVKKIVDDVNGRMGQEKGLSEFGKDVFNRSGFRDKIGLGSTVDVHTKWMEPVVKEHIRIIERHVYTIIINQEVHKYHIYPKIQPIFDPEPIMLEPRHRIFSPYDNEWHEVIGDAAAIAILGEDVFYNGAKTVREVRKSVLPGFEKENGEIEEGGVGRGLGRVREREGMLGGKWGPWKDANRGKLFERMITPMPSIIAHGDGKEREVSKSEIGVAV